MELDYRRNNMSSYNLNEEIGIVKIKPNPLMGAVISCGWNIVFIFPFLWHYLRLVNTIAVFK